MGLQRCLHTREFGIQVAAQITLNPRDISSQHRLSARLQKDYLPIDQLIAVRKGVSLWNAQVRNHKFKTCSVIAPHLAEALERIGRGRGIVFIHQHQSRLALANNGKIGADGFADSGHFEITQTTHYRERSCDYAYLPEYALTASLR